jgi:hypothetical protein
MTEVRALREGRVPRAWAADRGGGRTHRARLLRLGGVDGAAGPRNRDRSRLRLHLVQQGLRLCLQLLLQRRRKLTERGRRHDGLHGAVLLLNRLLLRTRRTLHRRRLLTWHSRRRRERFRVRVGWRCGLRALASSRFRSLQSGIDRRRSRRRFRRHRLRIRRADRVCRRRRRRRKSRHALTLISLSARRRARRDRRLRLLATGALLRLKLRGAGGGMDLRRAGCERRRCRRRCDRLHGRRHRLRLRHLRRSTRGPSSCEVGSARARRRGLSNLRLGFLRFGRFARRCDAFPPTALVMRAIARLACRRTSRLASCVNR